MTTGMGMREGLGRIDPSARIHANVTLGKNVTVREGAILYENVTVGDNTFVGPRVTLGEPLADYYRNPDYRNPPTVIGPDSIVRSGTVIYAGTRAGARLTTGHDAMIRENTELGEACSFGTFAMSDGNARLGDGCRIHYAVCIAANTVIGNRVIAYPYVVFADSLHPPCRRHLEGPTIGDETVILVHAVVLPRVKVGARCLVAANAVVVEDVPDGMTVAGVPGKIVKPAGEIPCQITPGHRPYPWAEGEE